jgi:hypothetical protein
MSINTLKPSLRLASFFQRDSGHCTEIVLVAQYATEPHFLERRTSEILM